MKVNYSFQKAARERAKQEKKEAKKRDNAVHSAAVDEPPAAPVETPPSETAVKT